MIDRIDRKNEEGYNDPTACEALNNILEYERKKAMHDIKRGDIFYISKYSGPVSADNPGRPAVVVSSDRIIRKCDFIQIAYCTLAPKYDLSTHVMVNFFGNKNVVLCEQVNTVNVDRIGDYIATCTEKEMNRIDIALLSAFGLNFGETEKPAPVVNVVNEATLPPTPAQAKLNAKLNELKENEDEEKRKTMVPTEEQIKRKIEEEKIMEKLDKVRRIGVLEGERDTYKAMYEKAIEALINK